MTVWFSGKEMQRGKILADSIGRNEKTTMIVKIQKVIILYHINRMIMICHSINVER